MKTTFKLYVSYLLIGLLLSCEKDVEIGNIPNQIVISGVVLDYFTQQPISNASIRQWGQNSFLFSTDSDDNGRFVIQGGIVYSSNIYLLFLFH